MVLSVVESSNTPEAGSIVPIAHKSVRDAAGTLQAYSREHVGGEAV